jgi:hypothetical protein
MPAFVGFAVAWQLSRVCSPVGLYVDLWWLLCWYYLVEEGFLDFAIVTYLGGYLRTSEREFACRSVVFGTGEVPVLRLAS